MLINVFALALLLTVAPLPTEQHGALRVMTWNVLHGGNDVDQGAEKALAIIREAAPDIVLMQESYDIDGDRPKLGKWLSEQLEWNYYQGESPHLCVLTSMDIQASFFHDPWHGLGAILTDDLGRSCLVWSIWLDYRSYISWDLRDNPEISDDELLAAEHEPRSPCLAAEIGIRPQILTGQLTPSGCSSVGVPCRFR